MSAGLGNRPQLRIGELSRRVGVNPEVLRAWERRYNLFSPARTDGGFRLYGEEDERRARRMLEYIAAGVSTAEAARLIRGEASPAPRSRPADTQAQAPAAGTQAPAEGATSAELGDRLRRDLDRFNDAGMHVVLDRLVGSYPLDVVLRDAVLPYLHQLGERWERGEVSVAQEHFASTLLHGRLMALARGWGGGQGPRALLACLPGDQHDLGLLCFGLALRGHGWRITFLGPDTPLRTLAQTADLLQPALVVLTATFSQALADAAGGLHELARTARLGIAGRGASAEMAAGIGALHLNEDPVTAAATIAAAANDEFSRPHRSKEA
jgi:MerR family transcriptional regulator, light-induced transcriptional regulator